jgi:hypothetical protein
MRLTITALFKGYEQAKLALKEIALENLASDDISLICPRGKKTAMEAGAELSPTGAPTPQAMSGLHGYLVQMGPLAVPELGQIHIAGPLAGDLTTGSDRSLVHALMGYGLSEEYAKNYVDAIKDGCLFTLITTDSTKASTVVNTLSSYGGKEINKWNKNTGNNTKVTKSP